ncbi:MAG: ATP-binding cassette domain-containing protein [Ignavibacteria bacterium]|nr:ATP-binding cassette domain-containing protein [Ignavibacteria bacterium]
MSLILEISNLNYSPPDSDVRILEDVNLKVERGAMYGIAGESGSGKTTLLKIIAGILTPTEGSVKIGTTKIQLLFQNNEFIINPYRRIDKMIDEAVMLDDKKSNAELERERIFDLVNFQRALWNKKGMQLSGGERQKAALARLLAIKPELLILDEPFSAQDLDAQIDLVKLLVKLNKEHGLTILCVAHDLNVLKQFTEKLVVLYKGKIVEEGLTREVIEKPGHPYTKFLIAAGNLKLKPEDYLMNKNWSAAN